jgi:hypothetical protein
MEINPDNEALTQLREQWQKMLMLVMKKHGLKEVTIDAPDMQWLIDLNARGEMPFMIVLGRKRLGPEFGCTLVLCESKAEMIERIALHQGRG